VGPLCDALTDRDDGSTTLVALERANLFLVALDDRREWYRYHHLFADVLRARLLDEQPDLVPLLHGRASRWFEDHELAEDAVRHALAAADAERAARLIEQALPSLRRDRRDAVLVGWLQALPDDVVRRSPVLAVFSGHLLMASGDLDGAEGRLDAAEQALAAVPQGEDPPWADSEELRSLPATIAVFRASLAQARGDGAGTAGHARRALLLAGPDDHLARSAAAGFLGLSEWVTGDVSTALATFGQAVASLRAAGNVIDELGSTVVLADMEVSAGRPSRARALYERALQRAEAHGRPVARATAELHVGLGELDVEIGRLAEAGRHLDTAAALAAPAATTESSHRWFVAMAAAARAEGDPATAIALLDQAEQLYRPGFFPDVRPIAALRARIWIAEGRLAEADDWARRRDVAGGGGFLREFDQLTLVRLLLAQHRAHQGADPAGQAVALLERLHGAAEASGRARSVLEIRLLAALAHDARGRSAEALETLAQALTLAPEPEGTARLFLDEGAPMTALLGELQRRRLAGDHPRRILTAGAAEAGGTESPGAAPRLPLADPLSERELQVLTLLDSELSGPEIARRLFVSDNTLRSHTKHIFTKLGVTSRRAAVRIGHERGLI
jgi:LuxR family maltose regulon positive regulatory protein